MTQDTDKSSPDVAGLIAVGEPCSLAACQIGLFMAGGELCLKTEYGDNEGRIDAYIVSSGEFFWGGTDNSPDQRRIVVQPIALQLLSHNGYADAFYEMGRLLDIPAQPLSPKEVWEQQMRPRLAALQRLSQCGEVGEWPEHASPLPWKYERRPSRSELGWRDWIEDANGNIVVEHIGHIDGPAICGCVNAGLPEKMGVDQLLSALTPSARPSGGVDEITDGMVYSAQAELLGGVNSKTVRLALEAALAVPAQEVECIACEDAPKAPNIPCAVCGKRPTPTEQPDNGHSPELIAGLERVADTLRSRPVELRGPFKTKLAPDGVDGGELDVVAWMHPSSRWATSRSHEINAHCRKDGSDGGPRPLTDLTKAKALIAEKDAEVERLRDLFKTQSNGHAEHVKSLLHAHESEREVYGNSAQEFRDRAEALSQRLEEAEERLHDLMTRPTDPGARERTRAFLSKGNDHGL